MKVGPLDASNVKLALPIAHLWDYDEREFERLVRWSEGCSSVAVDAREGVGMALAFPWGRVGWIGSVRVLDAHRGHGIGQQIVQASVDALRAHGCRTVKLYSMPAAISLYERVGFVGETECLIVRGGHRRGRDPRVAPLADHLDDALALDASVFPGDRSRLIEELAAAEPRTAVVALAADGAVAGFGLARSGEPSEVGPVVVRDADAAVAQVVVDALLSRVPEGDVEVIYPRGSFAGKSSWDCRGFTVVDAPLEMRLGPPVEEARECIVACGGQEVG